MEERWWRTEFIHGGGGEQKIIFKSQSKGYCLETANICTYLSISHIIHSSAKCYLPSLCLDKTTVFFHVSAKTMFIPHFPTSTLLLNHTSQTEKHQFLSSYQENNHRIFIASVVVYLSLDWKILPYFLYLVLSRYIINVCQIKE